MGNSEGNFQDDWDFIYAHPQLQGGFIWDWVDQGLAARTRDGTPFFAYGGDYGPPGTPSDFNFDFNGLVASRPDAAPALLRGPEGLPADHHADDRRRRARCGS